MINIQNGGSYNLANAMKLIRMHRGPICCDVRISLDDYAWIEVKKGDLLKTLKYTLESASSWGKYSFNVTDGVAYFSTDY